MLRGSGLYPKPNVAEIIPLCLIILAFSQSKKLFYFLLLPFTLAYILYMPIGFNFGSPSYQGIASLFATDITESTEFLTQIPLKHFLYSIITLILILISYFIIKKQHINLFHNKLFTCLIIVFLTYSQSPFKFITLANKEYQQVKKELDFLNGFELNSKWGKSELTNKSIYDDYILIIGESARRDYHHAYGYPIPNTPFMSSTNGILVNGLTSGGTFTIGSLKLMLTKPQKLKWQENYSLTLIDLINSAGIKTYWLSNQGYFGKWDTAVSALANKSDMRFFLKGGDFQSKNTSDIELLPKFTNILNTKYNGKRFIVLHLYGSHPYACDRIKDYHKLLDDKDIQAKHRYLNCYISSINKTDDFIKKVYELLKENKNHRTFSMIYFADHGQCHKDQGGLSIFNQSCTSKLHNNVPLFKISSDDTERKEYNSFKSGLNFTEAIANWIGIKNDQVDPTFDLFDNKNDPTDYGLQEQINKRNTILDPAIDIRPKE